MRKAVVAIALLALLITAGAGTQFTTIVTAQPEMKWESPPIISIYSPLNNTYLNVNQILLNLTITKSEDWLKSMSAPNWHVWQELQKVSYQIDGETYGTVNVSSNLSTPFTYTVILTNLTDRQHELTVIAYASAFGYQQWYSYPRSFTINSSSTVYFSLDTASPRIIVLSLENKTYHTSSVPLNFTVDELNSQIKYSLDGQENASITGNITLTNLSYGEHNITVFATDEAGNTGASETIYFTLSREPEPEPFPVVPIAAVSVAVALVAAGLLVYHKKQKQRETNTLEIK